MPDLSFNIKAEDGTGSGLSSVSKEIEGAGSSAEGANGKLGGLSEGLGKLALAAGGVGLAMGAKQLLGDSLGAVEELAGGVKKLQTAIGGTPEDASRLKFAMGELGVNADEGERSLAKFSKGLAGLQENEDGTTTKSTALVTQLKAIGITSQDASGNTLPMTDVLGQLADKFQGMPDGAEKTALAMQLFGKSGVDLIPFLNKGKDGLADLEKESDKLGLTLSGPTLQSVKDMTAAHRTFDAAMEGVKVQIGVALLPVMTFLAEKGTQLAVVFNQAVVPAIKLAAEFLQTQLAPVFLKISELIPQIIAHVVQFATALAAQLQPTLLAIWAVLPGIIAAVVSFGEALAAKLLPIVQQIVTGLESHRQVAMALGVVIATLVAGPIALLIAAAVLIVTHWKDLQQAFNDILPTLITLGAFFSNLFTSIQQEAQPLVDWFNTVFWPQLQLDFQAIVDFFDNVLIPAVQATLAWIQQHWAQISDFFQGPLEIVKALVSGAFAQIKATIEFAMRVLGDIITAAMDLIHGDWQGAWKAISDIPVAIFDFLKTTIRNFLTEAAGILKGGWDLLKSEMQLAWDGLQAIVPLAWAGMKAAVVAGIALVLTELKNLPGQLLTAVGDLANLLYQKGIDLITGFGRGIIDAAKNLPGQVGGAVQSAISNIPGVGGALSHIPGFAEGGIVTRPTLAVIGESGPEAVVPLRALGGAAINAGATPLGSGGAAGFSGGVTIHAPITIHINAMDAAGVNAAMPQITRVLDLYLKRLGQPGLAS